MSDGPVRVGKLRRARVPAVDITYEVGFGIRIAGERVPPDVDQAAAWIRALPRCRVRIFAGLQHDNAELVRFVKSVKRMNPKW